MIDHPATARAAFDELLELLRVDSLLSTQDALLVRLADIDIALRSIEAMADVTSPQSVRWNGVILKSIEIGGNIAHLVSDVLAWYALPDEPEGSNEPPIGSVYAQRLRSRYLEQLSVDEAFMMRLRDELAAFLSTLPQEPR